jgi:hypothetical protein
VRKAAATDIPGIRVLWEEAFGDANDYINRFIAHFGVERCFIHKINGKPAAMAFALPSEISMAKNTKNRISDIESLPLLYIYACATGMPYQNQGIMAKLLETIYQESCKENVAGIFLRPANKYLAAYYRKFGFEDYFFRNHYLYYKKTLISKGIEKSNLLNLISPETYHQKRIHKLVNNCFVNWDENFFRFLQETGIKFCEYGDTIFSYKKDFLQIIVDELLGSVPNEEIAHALIHQDTEFEAVHIRLHGNETCCGQIKWCKSSETNPNSGYFAFSME